MSLLHMVPRKAATERGERRLRFGQGSHRRRSVQARPFAKGDRIELARHDGYWGPKPAWDRVTFRLLTNDASRVAALLAGDVQMIEVMPPPDFAKVKANKDFERFHDIFQPHDLLPP